MPYIYSPFRSLTECVDYIIIVTYALSNRYQNSGSELILSYATYNLTSQTSLINLNVFRHHESAYLNNENSHIRNITELHLLRLLIEINTFMPLPRS